MDYLMDCAKANVILCQTILEQEIGQVQETLELVLDQLRDLEKKGEKLREALENIADDDPDNYSEWQNIARRALEEA